jgi:hypothetical protein
MTDTDKMPGENPAVASPAGIYDYWLGGPRTRKQTGTRRSGSGGHSPR